MLRVFSGNTPITPSIIQTLIDSPFSSPHYHHPSSLSFFTDWQKSKIKIHLVDFNNRAYGTSPSFSPLYPELTLGVRIINTFSDCFLFNHSNKKNNKHCLQQLDLMVIESSLSQSIAIVTTDASIKNDIATSISHTYILNQPLIKTIHHVVVATTYHEDKWSHKQ